MSGSAWDPNEGGEFVGVALVVVQLEAHAVVDLVVLELDVVLEDGVPLLDADLLRAVPPRRGEFFRSPIVSSSFHPYFAEAVVADDLIILLAAATARGDD